MGSYGAEVQNAAEASATAFNDASLMTPGMPGYAELVQLGLAHESHYDKESVLLNNIEKLGYTLSIQLRSFEVLHQQRQHTCVPMRGFAELMSQQCPERLLAGYKGESLSVFQQLLKRFWKCYQVYNASHPVFLEKSGALDCCIPIKVHTDEGTGVRKTAIYQYSWGPVIPKDMSSNNRYFYFSCIFHEQYRKHHAGYEAGNAVLDSLMKEMADQLTDVYQNGVEIATQRFFLVLTGLEGDLPAQARVCHCNLFIVFVRAVCFDTTGFFVIKLLWLKQV